MAKLLFRMSIVAVLAMCLGSGVALAQAAKSAVKISELILLDETTSSIGTWISIMHGEPVLLKNGSGKKDFFVGVSLECGMFTRTKVKGKEGSSLEADATAGVRVRVIMDQGTANQQIAKPFAAPTNLSGAGNFSEDFGHGIIYCRRNQNLKAVLGGVLDECTTTCVCNDPTDCTVITCETTCTFTDEEIELTLKTLEASHFNFLLVDVGASGSTHIIDVQVQVDIGAVADSPNEAEATAIIGRGSVTVQEVRLIKDADTTIDF